MRQNETPTETAGTPAPSDEGSAGSSILESDEDIYMAAMGEFYDAYMAAFEAETLSERWALMAVAEAKFLESGVATPMYTAGGCYAMSRMPFRAGGYASWLGDRVYYDQMVLTNEIITTEDYEHLVDMWYELTGTGTYTQSAVDYLTRRGYTFTDTATTTFDRVGTTWDRATAISMTMPALSIIFTSTTAKACSSPTWPRIMMSARMA